MGSFVQVEFVYDLLLKYKIAAEKRVIPTGIELEKFQRPEITEEDKADLSQTWYCF